MKFLAYLRSLAARFFHHSQTEDEIEEEFRSHIQHRVDDLERSGLDHDKAERGARGKDYQRDVNAKTVCLRYLSKPVGREAAVERPSRPYRAL
jgi:hypothetical protein